VKRNRVARWFSFKPKNPILGKNSEGLGMENVVFYVLWPFGMFFGDLVEFIAVWYMYFVVVCYIFSCFGMFVRGKIWQP
jgi:hypothetical protein